MNARSGIIQSLRAAAGRLTGMAIVVITDSASRQYIAHKNFDTPDNYSPWLHNGGPNRIFLEDSSSAATHVHIRFLARFGSEYTSTAQGSGMRQNKLMIVLREEGQRGHASYDNAGF